MKRGEEAFFYYGEDRDVIDDMLQLEDEKEDEKKSDENKIKEEEKGEGKEIETAENTGKLRTTKRRGRKN